MKNPLHYQISECDCGPTSMLNAISYLFDREDIPPEIIRNVMLYCLDCYSAEGVPGQSGTSRMAMMFLSNWLNEFGKIGRLSVNSAYLSGEDVYLGDSSRINDVLRRGGAVVVRLFLDEWHYVTLTGIQDDKIKMFDPYYWTEPYEEKDIEIHIIRWSITALCRSDILIRMKKNYMHWGRWQEEKQCYCPIERHF